MSPEMARTSRFLIHVYKILKILLSIINLHLAMECLYTREISIIVIILEVLPNDAAYTCCPMLHK